MRGISKFMVLGGGLIGLLGFFLPLLVVIEGQNEITISGSDVAGGLETIRATMAAFGNDGRELAGQVERYLDEAQIVLLTVYAPAAILLILGLIGVGKGSFGRLLGFLALVFGVALVGLYAVGHEGLAEANRQAQAALLETGQTGVDGELRGGFALFAMLIAGSLGVLGGLFGLVAPEVRARHGRR